jgi:hypothetical protein
MSETLTKEVFISLKIDTKIGRRANILKPNDYFANTHLARLLGKGHMLENQLMQDSEIPYAQFCKMHKISQRYLHALISLNNLSPTIKKHIMNGYVPKHLSVQDITNHKFPVSWKEQEEWFLDE